MPRCLLLSSLCGLLVLLPNGPVQGQPQVATPMKPLYLHWFRPAATGLPKETTAERILSTPVVLGQDMDITVGDGSCSLKGRIDVHGGGYHADLAGHYLTSTGYFDGACELGKRIDPSGYGFGSMIWLTYFVLSTEPTCEPLVEQDGPAAPGVKGAHSSAAQVAGDPAGKVDLQPLHDKVRALVKKYYPEASTSLDGTTIQFEYKTRKFMIHTPLMTGEWQDAHEAIGPQPGGVVGSIELCAGQYRGQVMLPQTFDDRYFLALELAPYSKQLNCHLRVSLKHPRNEAGEFLKEMWELLDHFDQHVAVRQ